MRSQPNIFKTVGIAALLVTLTAGCATPRWAKDDQWKKNTGWQHEPTDNPGLWGLFRSLDGLTFEP
jgi:hypothetical protein